MTSEATIVLPDLSEDLEDGLFQRLENNKRYTCLYGGRGGAKSFHISLYACELTYFMPKDHVILYTRYTMTSAEKSIIPEFREKIELLEELGAGYVEDFHITGNTITNILSGAKIIFSGIKTSSGNQTARLKSIPNLSVWINDESEELVNKEDFDKIDDSIRKKGALNWIFLIYNTDRVDQEHWLYKYFHESGERDDTEYIKPSYLNNLENLDPSFIRKAEASKEEDPEYYEINYMGAFPALRDSIYSNPHEIFTEDPEQYDWVGIGGDFGFSDNPTAASKVWRSGNDLYVREIIYEEGLTNDQIAERLGKDGRVINVWDSSEKKSIAELRRMDVNAYPAEKGPGSVVFGIKKMQSLKWHIHADSKNILNEKKRYRWKKLASGEYVRDSKGRRVPLKRNDHLLDGIRYVTSMLSGWVMSEE